MSKSITGNDQHLQWKLLYQLATSLNLKVSQEGLLESIGTFIVHETEFDVFTWHWIKADQASPPSGIWCQSDKYAPDSKGVVESLIKKNRASYDQMIKDALSAQILALNSGWAPYQALMVVPISLSGDKLALLHFFSREPAAVDSSLRADLPHLLTVEINRQIELHFWTEKERDEVVQLAESSRLSALGAMAGGIAHEINNPLTIIMGTLKLTIKELESNVEFNRTKYIEMLSKAKQFAERINKIVKGIRALSRDGAHDPFHPSRVQDILDNTLSLCEAAVEANNIQMSFELEDPELKIECRSVQISQVLLNLIQNSIDAIGNKSEAWIHLATKIDPNQHIEFSVTDSGAGIPEAVAIRLMQPFFTTKGTGKGTGLGLSISKEIIKAHQGQFYLDRESPHTRFVIRIPITQNHSTSTAN